MSSGLRIVALAFLPALSHAVAVNLAWDAVTTHTDGSGITDLSGYRIYSSTASFNRLGTWISTEAAAADPNVQILDILGAGTTAFASVATGSTYYFRLATLSFEGNQSAFNLDSLNNDVQISTYYPDTSSPTVPSGLAAVVVSSSQISLSWMASADNVGVSGYRLYRDGSLYDTAAGTTYLSSSLLPNTTYTYSVAAFDAAGNVSGQSTAVVAVTRRATWVRLVADPAASNMILLTVQSQDATFPGGASIAASVVLPYETVNATLVRLTVDPSSYFVQIPRASVNPQDFFMMAVSTLSVTVGTQTFTASGDATTVAPTLGGMLTEPSGMTHVTIAPNAITRNATLTINAVPTDSNGLRAVALVRQDLLALGSGRDFNFVTAGTFTGASLTMTFDPTLIPPGLDTSRVRVAYFNPAAGSWEVQGPVTIVGNTVQTTVAHFSLYAPVLLTPKSAPGLYGAYAYPNPAVGRDPVIRVEMGLLDSYEITIYDAAGDIVRSQGVGGTVSGITNGVYYYDYVWTGAKASGVYFALVHGKKSDGTLVKARVKFAVVR